MDVRLRSNQLAIVMAAVVQLYGCAGNNPPESPEHLLAQPPSGWVNVYQLVSKGNRISEFIPADEDPLTWTNKVTFESFATIPATDPIDLLLFDVDQYKKRCTFVQHFNLFSGYENNYPTSLRLVMCGKSNTLETGEVSMLKAISGDSNFYIVRITRKVPAFEPQHSGFTQEEIAQWSVYLRRISVCDESSINHPCDAAPEQAPSG